MKIGLRPRSSLLAAAHESQRKMMEHIRNQSIVTVGTATRTIVPF